MYAGIGFFMYLCRSWFGRKSKKHDEKSKVFKHGNFQGTYAPPRLKKIDAVIRHK
jgi:hypothetical protein